LERPLKSDFLCRWRDDASGGQWMMGGIARDLYLAKILVLVCRVVPEACRIELRPTLWRVIWDGTTTVERWSCTLRWLFAAT
jgi:hypothetical protein